MNLLIFCGGRGAAGIQNSLAKVPEIKVAFVINGYDSGASTGYLRRSIPGFLGPSDFRKSLSSLLAANSTTTGVATLLEARIKLREIQEVTKNGNWLAFLAANFPSITIQNASVIADWMHSLPNSIFLTSGLDMEMAIGNLFYAAEFLDHKNFNKAVENVSKKMGLAEQFQILNVSGGEDLWLTAIADNNNASVEEEEIVGVSPPSTISDLMLISRENYFEFTDYRKWGTLETSAFNRLKSCNVVPSLNSKIPDLILSSDAVIYSTGTRHSSLFPSYLTKDLGPLLSKKLDSNRIYMCNSKRDLDIHNQQTEIDLLDAHKRSMGGLETIDVVWVAEGADADYCPNFGQQNSANSDGVNSLWLERKTALNSLQQFSPLSFHLLVSREIDPHTQTLAFAATGITSLIIPSCEPESRLSLALAMLRTSLDQTEEIFEITIAYNPKFPVSDELKKMYPMINFVVSNGSSRYAAITTALNASRGEKVILWCADLEYSSHDLLKLSKMLRSDSGVVLLGSRNHYAISDSELKTAYKDHPFLFWVSRIGGVVLTGLLAIRIGRFASDPLCGIIAGERKLLERVLPESGGAEGNVAAILNLRWKRIPFVEVGLRYQPRSRAAGKTTGLKDGIKGILLNLKVTH